MIDTNLVDKKTRKDCLILGLHRSASVILIDVDERIYIQKRAGYARSYPSHLTLSYRGVSSGDWYAHSGSRKVREELGINAQAQILVKETDPKN